MTMFAADVHVNAILCCGCCRLKKLHEEFYEHVDPAEVADILDVDLDTIDCMYSYWVYKRKVVFTVLILTKLLLDHATCTQSVRRYTCVACFVVFYGCSFGAGITLISFRQLGTLPS